MSNTLKRRKGDLRSDVINISALLTAYGKVTTDVVDVIFQLFYKDTLKVNKKITDTGSTVILAVDGNVTVNWEAADYTTLQLGPYRLAIGVKFDADEEDQNPDEYQIELNGKTVSLGETPEYNIVAKATE